MNNGTSRSTSQQQQQQQQQQACAACKHQRKKCGPNCILAPYFPHNRQTEFLNAHKLFGVGKISSMIKPLSLEDRNMAMKTIIFQADMRAYDPVGGCYRLIQQLQSQIGYHQAELQLLLQQLAMFKAQSQHAYHPTTTHAIVNNFDHADPLNLYNLVPPNNVADNNFTCHQYLQQFQREATHFDSNGKSMHEDLSALIMRNSISLSPLAGSNGNGNTSVDNDDYGFDGKPMIDLGIEGMNSDTKH